MFAFWQGSVKAHCLIAADFCNFANGCEKGVVEANVQDTGSSLDYPPTGQGRQHQLDLSSLGGGGGGGGGVAGFSSLHDNHSLPTGRAQARGMPVQD